MERTELEKKLEELTLEYVKKYQGQNNYAQREKYEEIKLLIGTISTLFPRPMIALTKEQLDYVQMKQDQSAIWNHRQTLDEEERIPHCVPVPKGTYFEHSMISRDNYLLLEIMEGKHNDFLQQIIDSTPK